MFKKLSIFSLFLLFLLALFSCGTLPVSSIVPADMIGDWTSGWDWYSISSDGTRFTYYINGDPTNDIGYAGTIVQFDESGDYSFLTIQITNGGIFYLTKDYFSRIAFQKEMTSYKNSLGTIVDGTGDTATYTSALPTLNEALNQFTIESETFSYWALYNRK